MSLLQAIQIEEPSIITVVGAGGKTSTIQTLTDELVKQRMSCLVTTTTRMLYQQLPAFPRVALQQYDKGIHYVKKYLSTHTCCSWIAKWELEKAIGLCPGWINNAFCDLERNAFVLVEGDGAASKLIKAPAVHEPVIPSLTSYTIGVLNLNAIDQPLSANVAHRLEYVSRIVGKEPGELVTPEDLARLALSNDGIFARSTGTCILLLSGVATESSTEKIIDYLTFNNRSKIARCVVTSGYGKEMIPIRTYNLE